MKPDGDLHTLNPHPSQADAAAGFAVTCRVVPMPANRVRLSWTVRGPIDALVVAEQADASRQDGLWEATCFEAFVRPVGQSVYREYNLAPSSLWQAYDFDSYRDGSRVAEQETPDFARSEDVDRLTVAATFALPEAWRDADLDLGLTTVLEHRDGTKTLWALCHGDGAPDFHDGDCFVARVTATERA